MKYNQYGRINVGQADQIKELIALKFLPAEYETLEFSDLLGLLFGKLFPEQKTIGAKRQTLSAIAADETQSIFALIEQHVTEITQNNFYNVALQLLGYHAGYDYDLGNPLALFKEHNLPFLQANKINQENIFNAYYLLLSTRAKNGQLLIDHLAAKGYFVPWFKAEKPQFVYFNGKSLPVFDTTKIIREVVYVESDLDTDHDGQKDLLQATIFRPQETEQNLRVPILYTANPYWGGTSDVDDHLHSVDENLTEIKENPVYRQPAPNLKEKSVPSTENAVPEETATRNGIYSLNEYFLARGFANVYAGGIGTYGSDGVRLCGSAEETICAKEIIEWLTGNRIAYTTRERTTQTKAWWSNGNVAMTGKSYLGTLATAVATTGVKGLKTVISEAAISSWYDYYREHGLVIAPVLCQGEDTDILAELCQSNFQQSADYLRNKPYFDKVMQALVAGQDRTTGQYNDFWAARNYRHNVKNIKCSFISVHGLNDWNVKPKNVYKLWDELQNLPIKHKLFLHQGPHTYMNNLQSIDFTDMINLWLAHELLGVKNGALIQWPDVLVQDNLQADTWHSEQTWSNNLGQATTYHLNNNQQLAKNQDAASIHSFEDVGGKQFHEMNISETEWEKQFLGGTKSWLDAQLRFMSEPLDFPVTLVGRPKVHLRVSSSLKKGQLSVALIELGRRSRLSAVPQVVDLNGQELGYHFGTESLKEFQPARPTDFKLIAKGHQNIQNYANQRIARSVTPGEFYDLEFELQPTYYTLPKDTQLALVVYSTDQGMTKRPQESTTYTVDLAQSSITVFQK